MRNGVDKWGVPVETYALNHYPIYVPGSSYVVTMDIVAGNLMLDLISFLLIRKGRVNKHEQNY